MHYISIYIYISISISIYLMPPPIYMMLYLYIGNIQTVQAQELEHWAESESLLSQDNKRLDFVEYRLGVEISNWQVAGRQERLKFINEMGAMSSTCFFFLSPTSSGSSSTF